MQKDIWKRKATGRKGLIGSIAALTVLSACSKQVEQRPEDAPIDGWSSTLLTPSSTPAYVGNGNLGLRLPAAGYCDPADEVSSPAFLLLRDRLYKFRNPLTMSVRFGDWNPSGEQSWATYRDELDFRTGVRTVHLVENVGGETRRVRVSVRVHPILNSVLVKMRFESPLDEPQKLSIQCVGAGEAARVPGDADRFRFMAELQPVSPGEASGTERIQGELLISSRPEQRRWSLTETESGLRAEAQLEGGAEEVELLVSFDNGSELRNAEDFDASANDVWRTRWKTDIEVDGPAEDQRAVRSFLYYLWSNSSEKLPPMGVSHDRYKGHRFWDAEAWMLPVLCFIDPELAERATQWRLKRTNGKVPWEAGADGEELAPPEFQEAYHATGWVAWWAHRAHALGFIPADDADRAAVNAANVFLERASKTQRGWEILQVESPDEGRLRNNDLVTNLLAKWCAERAALTGAARTAEDASTFLAFAEGIQIPTDSSGAPITYEGDALKGYQQAAALLALYPLEWPFSAATSEAMFDRYKGLAWRDGPAMSDSIHATIACRLARRDEAYRLWKESWTAFLREPHLLFAERADSGDAYFSTGAAGCLQTVIYGFLGVRLEPAEGPPPRASKPLDGGVRLTLNPCLPSEWRRVTFKNVPILGKRYTLEATHGGVSIREGGE